MDGTLKQLLAALYQQDMTIMQKDQRIAELELEVAALKAQVAVEAVKAEAVDLNVAVEKNLIDHIHAGLLNRQRSGRLGLS